MRRLGVSELPGVEGEMVIEAAAQLVMRVGHGGRGEQQTGAFYRSAGDDEDAGEKAELAGAVVEDADGFNGGGCAAMLKRSCVGMGEDGDVAAGEGCRAERLGEVAPGEGRPFGVAQSDVRREGDGRVAQRREQGGGVGEGVNLKDALDVRVVGGEVLL